MKKYILSLILICLIGAFGQAQDFEVETIQENGAIDKRINLVFLSDGYLQTDLNDYIDDVERILAELFTTVPFREYQQYFNVYAIKVPSNEAGASRDPDNLIDNYFGSTYFFAGIERLLVPTKNDRVAAVLAANFPEYDQAFVLVNDDKYGGSGGWLATSSTNENAGQIAIHEIGHSLAGLADEYWAGVQFTRETHNMTQDNNPATVRWANWHGENEVGIYPHSGDASWYRPHQNCKMEFLGVPFCSVCSEAFIHTFYGMTGAIDSHSPEQQNEVNSQQAFAAETLVPDPYTLENFWLMNGDTLAKNEAAFSLETGGLSNGTHQLTFNVVDLTPLSRRDEIPMDIVTWSISINGATASINGNVSQQTIRRSTLFENEVTGIDDDFIREIGLTTFPNPVVDQLKITFNNPSPAAFNMQLIDLNGKVFQAVDRSLLAQGEQEFLINTSALRKGVFLIQMQIGSKLVVKKVLK